MKYGIIDIGSNTIRLSVYDYDENDLKLLVNKKIMAGLAGHVEDGILTKKGIQKAIDALLEFKRLITNFDLKAVYPFATASLRNVSNAIEAIKVIQDATGFNIDLISGEQEAMCDFIGATHSVRIDNGILLDIGGGSTEIVAFNKDKIIKATSLPMGSLNLYSEYVLDIFPTSKEWSKIKKRVISGIEKLDGFDKGDSGILCGIGGSIRSILKLNNDIFGFNADNREIDVANLKKINKLLKENSKQKVKIISQTVPDRMHTITPGMIILNSYVKHFNIKKIIVSSFGVREGYLYFKLSK